MVIRKAADPDFAAIKATVALYPDELMQTHLPKPEEFFIAEEDGAVVGCCALEVYSQRLAEIRSLAVLPDFQRRGIAAALIDACMREARDKNIYEVLTITGVTALFEKHGFAAFNNERYALFNIIRDEP